MSPAFATAVAALATAVVGCGPAFPPSGCQGEVSFAGEPVPTGTIRFFPLAGTPGPGAAAKLNASHYEIPVGAGLAAGTYMVGISATRPTGRTVRPEPGYESAGPVADEEQYIPDRFNARSTLRVTLEEGENQHDFHLSPRD